MLTMPPLPSIPNVLRVDLIWATSGDTDLDSRQFFRYSGGPPSATDATSFAFSIYSAMAAENAQWGADVDLTNVIVTDLSAATGARGEESSSTAGGKTPGALSAATALLINYHISRRYRGGKPRNYLPWLVETDLSNRRSWNPAAVSAAEGALSTYFAAVIGLTSGSTTITDHVNVSYYDGFTVVTSPTTGRSRNVPKLRTTPLIDTVTGFAGSLRPGSQRRRN